MRVGDEGGINREMIPASSTLTWYLLEHGALSSYLRLMDFVSLNSRLESNKEDKEHGALSRRVAELVMAL